MIAVAQVTVLVSMIQMSIFRQPRQGSLSSGRTIMIHASTFSLPYCVQFCSRERWMHSARWGCLWLWLVLCVSGIPLCSDMRTHLAPRLIYIKPGWSHRGFMTAMAAAPNGKNKKLALPVPSACPSALSNLQYSLRCLCFRSWATTGSTAVPPTRARPTSTHALCWTVSPPAVTVFVGVRSSSAAALPTSQMLRPPSRCA